MSGIKFQLDPHSGVPVYRQLMDQVRQMVAGGTLREGDELPTTRHLSESLKVNPMTVSKAYSFLEMEGLVERRRGVPLRVSAGADRGALARGEMDKLLEEVVKAAGRLDLDEATVTNLLKKHFNQQKEKA